MLLWVAWDEPKLAEGVELRVLVRALRLVHLALVGLTAIVVDAHVVAVHTMVRMGKPTLGSSPRIVLIYLRVRCPFSVLSKTHSNSLVS